MSQPLEGRGWFFQQIVWEKLDAHLQNMWISNFYILCMTFFLHSSHTISLSYSVEQGVPAGSRHIMALKSQLHKTVVNCLILGIQSRLDMVLFFRLATVKGFSPLISGIHAQMWLLSLWFLHLGLTNESKQSNLTSWALVNPYLKDVSN